MTDRRLALLLLAFALPAASSRAQTAPARLQALLEGQKLGAYLQIVSVYRSGRFDEATDAVLGWTPRDVERAARALTDLARRPGLVDCRSGPWEVEIADGSAAVLLETDAALRASARHDKAALSVHLAIGQWLLERLAEENGARRSPGDAAAQGCQRPPPVTRLEWYLATTQVLQGDWELILADRLASYALKHLPADARMLSATGAAKEALALDLAHSPPQPQDPRSAALGRTPPVMMRDRLLARNLREAEALFREALVREPALLEARLHLGRVLSILDRPADARVELQACLDGAPAAEERYLAHLFLARIDEQDGQLDTAADNYRAAIQVVPTCQAARLGLARVLERGGDLASGAPTLDGFLDQPWPRDNMDEPWWVYSFAGFRQGSQRLDELRRRVVKP